MKASDKKYYENLAQHDEKRARAISKAAYRGGKAIEWQKTNKLTAETLPIFKKVMKHADKEWELLNQKR